jgi:hypothetical protein
MPPDTRTWVKFRQFARFDSGPHFGVDERLPDRVRLLFDGSLENVPVDVILMLDEPDATEQVMRVEKNRERVWASLVTAFNNRDSQIIILQFAISSLLQQSCNI